MVFYFTSKSGTVMYMGRDKYENEDLIKHSLPHDVWFHVDNLSSAHVYLRLDDGQTIADISAEQVEECSQLTKANSIKGCKMAQVPIVYTLASNLRKTNDMATGQVGFHRHGDVKKYVVKKNNELVNRLNRTKTEEDTAHFKRERDEWEVEQRQRENQRRREEREAEAHAKAEALRKKEELEKRREQLSYKEDTEFMSLMSGVDDLGLGAGAGGGSGSDGGSGGGSDGGSDAGSDISDLM